ncbi:MFS transporter, DHA1 family, inner membrane transport protein [Cupriavidus metallidurans]|jgi:DHA1 family inner membrane transport protein|uniref:MFS transporter n=1 Tax=Cupriavidus TaxID=106589 RepID=UPI00049359DE|nr:MFS transporter [Cupriavidus metallidurans]KWW39618.1 Inner membrane transport protein YdhP [Cupriavidus metallidurans]MDE4920834.1 MFS transporter [Cupriavidus metallidurans]UBM07424.1 MFS transporter [Cupriavidus metallidurans]
MTAPHGNFDSVPDLTRSSPNSSTEGDAATARDRAADRRALLALGVGSFGIGTGEFVIMGLLPDAARDLAITIPEAGHLISAYALGVVIGAPLLAVLGARWPRRNLLIALMSVFALGNFASALAPGYLPMLAVRLLTGFPHGTYFGVAALVAASLVARERRAQAVGLVMLGLTVATLVGVPIAAGIGTWLGWRAAFVIVGAIGALTALLVWRWVPFVPADRHASPLRELSALARKQVWFTLGIGAIGFGGMFAVFSYVKPTMLEVAHMPASGIPIVLALFGVGMVAGNLAGAKLADKALMPTIGGVLLWSALVLGAFVYTAPHPWLASLNVMLVGTAVALGPPLQIRLMDVAGDAQTLAAALNHSAFNMANALGAWLGGVTIAAGLGWTSTGWVGMLLALAGMVVFGWSLMSASRRDITVTA